MRHSFFHMPIILPENVAPQPLAAIPSVQTVVNIDHEIDAIIERLLSIGLRRCCADFQAATHEFLQRKTMLQKNGRFAYLNDPYLQTLALAGEEHLCKASSRQQLRQLFMLREEVLATSSSDSLLRENLDLATAT